MDDLVTSFSSHLDFRQTKEYAKITRSLSWQTLGKPGTYLYLKQIGPLAIAKYQRPTLIDFNELSKLRKKHHILWTFVEPGLGTKFIGRKPRFSLKSDPYAHSATAIINLNLAHSKLLSNLSSSTRTKIRHAQKNLTLSSTPLTHCTQKDLDDFIALANSWSQTKKVIGYDGKYLRTILATYANSAHFVSARHDGNLVSQLLLINHGDISTAFCIFTSPLGYKLRAPLLLNWEAILVAKRLGSTIFDFFGLYDDRYPSMYRKWRGFSLSKLLFNPTKISFPPSFLLLGW